MEEKKEIFYKRIVYRKSKIRPGWLESAISFISSSRGTEYKVYIDLENKKYYIKNMTREGLIHMPDEIKVNNKSILYGHAKDHLMRLGVRFKQEIRNRTYGLCSKGYTQAIHLQKLKNNTDNHNQ